VALFIPDLTIGGAERVVVNLSNGLVKAGYTVELVVYRKDGELLDQLSTDVCVVELEVDAVRNSLIPLKSYISSRNPEAMICFMTENNIIGILANIWVGGKTSVIVTEHNTQSKKKSISAKRDRFIAKYLYEYADSVVGVSEGVSDDVSEWARLDRQDISTIYNPVVQRNTFNESRDQPDINWYKDDIPLILSAGRHVEQKDFSTLIKSFNNLLEYRDARLVILGEGEKSKEYERLAENLGLSNKVCLPGYVDDPYSHMEHADVFVLSSRWEGHPLVLIEAMACGTPVVSTDCPHGPAEVLDDGTYGQLVPVGDESKLAEGIRQTLNSPIDSKKLEERSHDFSVKAAVKKYEQIL